MIRTLIPSKPNLHKLASTQEKPTSAQPSEPRVISSVLDLETNPEPKESSTPLNLEHISSTPLNLEPSPSGTSTPTPVELVSTRPNKYKIDDSYVVPEPLDLEKLINSESPNQVFFILFYLFFSFLFIFSLILSILVYFK